MEQWRDVPSWVGWYQVSDQGRVRSLPRVSIAGGHRATYQGKVLAAGGGKHGYSLVTFTSPGRRQCRNVHTLVLEAFVGLRPEGMECCHNNGVRADNRLENLRYDTRSANARDRIAHGNGPKKGHLAGIENSNARLTEREVLTIRGMDGTLAEIAAHYGVHLGTIHCIKTRKTWKHLT